MERFKKDRIVKTLDFLKRSEVNLTTKKVLDLGERNDMANFLIDKLGVLIINTDLDLNEAEGRREVVEKSGGLIFAFQILEHLSNGNQLLRELPSGTRLYCSVPLKTFIKPHWNNSDPRDCHVYEWTSYQFDKYLTDAGFRVIRARKLTIDSQKLYSRLFFKFYKRDYIVEAIKN
jgi:hypothetical protein